MRDLHGAARGCDQGEIEIHVYREMFVLNTRKNHDALLLICTQLPCGHKFCKKCIEEWEKQRGADKACPLCRNPLPPGPEKLFDLGYGMYAKINGAVDRSRPRVDPKTPWPALVGDQKREMDQAVVMLREAADQEHMDAQVICGSIYGFGYGMAEDDRLAFVYTEKAAQQGHTQCEHKIGIYYRDSLGCEQSHELAAEFQLCTKRIVIPSGVQVHCQ